MRPARDEDRPFLLSVYASTREQELAILPWTAEQKRAFLEQQFEAQDRDYRANYPEAEFLVIQVDGNDAGRLSLHAAESEIRVIDIALLPAARRLGLGTRILRDILASGEATGKRVTMHVERLNPALRLYERLGFRTVGEAGIHLLLEWRPPRSPS